MYSNTISYTINKVVDKKARSESGSVSQMYGSADLDPYQNVADREDCKPHFVSSPDKDPTINCSQKKSDVNLFKI